MAFRRIILQGEHLLSHPDCADPSHRLKGSGLTVMVEESEHTQALAPFGIGTKQIKPSVIPSLNSNVVLISQVGNLIDWIVHAALEP
jgi:hypothetical protein